MRTRVLTVVMFVSALFFACVFGATAESRNVPVATPTASLYLPALSAHVERTPAPTSTATPTETPVPTPTPGGIDVVSSNLEQTRWSSSEFYLYVEIQNRSDLDACLPKVAAQAYDANGGQVAAGDNYAFLFRLSPQQKAPVRLRLSDASKGIASYKLEISTSACPFNAYPVTVLSADTRETTTGVEVFGEVRNDSGIVLTYIKVVSTFYKPDGRILVADMNFISGDTNDYRLDPGAVGAYVIHTLDQGISALPYTVQSEGQE